MLSKNTLPRSFIIGIADRVWVCSSFLCTVGKANARPDGVIDEKEKEAKWISVLLQQSG